MKSAVKMAPVVLELHRRSAEVHARVPSVDGIQRQMRRLLRSTRRAAARQLRRGDRLILCPHRGSGFGNVLYLWLQAHAKQARGQNCRVLLTPAMEPWLERLPLVREQLVITSRDVRIWDRRESGYYMVFGEDFTRPELHAFIGECLVGSPLLGTPLPRPEVVTVNVRRGGYYSKPVLRGLYGFDILGYLEVALPRVMAAGQEVDTIRVVSDDIDWCMLKLDAILRRFAPSIEYAPRTDSPQENFRLVAGAMRLVSTNSTFTYWAGFVSNVLFGSDSHVVVPIFHARHLEGGRARGIDPNWDIVEDIPGGWDA